MKKFLLVLALFAFTMGMVSADNAIVVSGVSPGNVVDTAIGVEYIRSNNDNIDFTFGYTSTIDMFNQSEDFTRYSAELGKRLEFGVPFEGLMVGIGIGVYRVELANMTTTNAGAYAIAHYNLSNGLFAQAKYVDVSNLDAVDGWSVGLGLRF